MLCGRFICTLNIPTLRAGGIVDGRFVFSIDNLKKFVEEKRPSLKNKHYNIRF